MLLRLIVRDFVIVDRIELEFGGGFGALTGEAGGERQFTREQVGKITVTDQSTYVAVARNLAREAVRKLTAGKVKGKTVKVRAL